MNKRIRWWTFVAIGISLCNPFPLYADSDVTLDISQAQTYAAGANVSMVALSPFSTTIAAGLSDGQVDLWFMPDSSHKVMLDSAAEHSRVTALRFSANGAYLAASFKDGNVIVWPTSPPNGPLVFRSSFHSEATSVDISPDESAVAAGYENGKAIVWSIVNNAKDGPIWELDSGRRKVLSVAYNRLGDKLIVFSDGGNLNRFDTSTGAAEPEVSINGYDGKPKGVRETSSISSTATADYGQTLAIGFQNTIDAGYGEFENVIYEPNLTIVDTTTASDQRRLLGIGHTENSRLIALSEDATLAATVGDNANGDDDNGVHIWDVHRGEIAATPKLSANVTTLAFGRGATGLQLAVAAGNQIVVYLISFKPSQDPLLPTETLAVIVTPVDQAAKDFALVMSDAVEEAVSDSGHYILLTRDNQDEALTRAEIRRSQTDLADPATIVKVIGKLMDVECWMIGQVARTDETHVHLSLRLFKTGTSVNATTSRDVSNSVDAIENAATDMVTQLLKNAKPDPN